MRGENSSISVDVLRKAPISKNAPRCPVGVWEYELEGRGPEFINSKSASSSSTTKDEFTQPGDSAQNIHHAAHREENASPTHHARLLNNRKKKLSTRRRRETSSSPGDLSSPGGGLSSSRSPGERRRLFCGGASEQTERRRQELPTSRTAESLALMELETAQSPRERKARDTFSVRDGVSRGFFEIVEEVLLEKKICFFCARRSAKVLALFQRQLRADTAHVEYSS